MFFAQFGQNLPSHTFAPFLIPSISPITDRSARLALLCRLWLLPTSQSHIRHSFLQRLPLDGGQQLTDGLLLRHMIPLVVCHIAPSYHLLNPLGKVTGGYLLHKLSRLLLQSFLVVGEYDGSLLGSAEVNIGGVAVLSSARGRHICYHEIHAHALGFVVGHSVAVINVVILPHVKGDLLPAVGSDGENAALDGFYLSHRAIEDTKAAVVGGEDDSVPSGKTAFLWHIFLPVVGSDFE